MMNLRRMLVVLLLAATAAATTGCCGGPNVPFDFYEDSYKLRGGSIAVVSGSTDDADVRYANHVTKKLQEMSTLNVLSQREVGRRVGKYPVNIKIGEPKDKDKPVWYLPGEQKKVNGIAGALKTDYVLVVWVTNVNRIVTHSNTGTSVSYGASVVGNLLERSRGRSVGYSEFGRSRQQSCFLFGGSEGKDIDNLIKDAAEDMADDLVSRTGTRKNR